MADAAKFLITMHMLGMMVEETRIERTCSNCRFRIEHEGLGRCARCGKVTVLDGSCRHWEVILDD